MELIQLLKVGMHSWSKSISTNSCQSRQEEDRDGCLSDQPDVISYRCAVNAAVCQPSNAGAHLEDHLLLPKYIIRHPIEENLEF